VIQKRDKRGGASFVDGAWPEYEKGFGNAKNGDEYYIGMMSLFLLSTPP